MSFRRIYLCLSILTVYFTHQVHSQTASPSTASTASATSSSATVTASAQGVSGWSYVGCYHDHDGLRRGSERLIGNATVTYGNMNLDACQRYCGSGAAGSPYQYFGVETAVECWCGDDLNLSTGNYLGQDSDCNMPCADDATELCGGAWYINVYSAIMSATPTSQTTTSSTKAPVVSAPTSSSASTSSANASKSSSKPATVSAGTVAAAVIAGVAGLAAIIIASLFLVQRRRRQQNDSNYSNVSQHPYDPQHPEFMGQAAKPLEPQQLGGTPRFELSQHGG